MNHEHFPNVYNDCVFDVNNPPPRPVLKRSFPVSGPKWWCPDCKNPLASLYQMCEECGHNPTKIVAELDWFNKKPVNKL